MSALRPAGLLRVLLLLSATLRLAAEPPLPPLPPTADEARREVARFVPPGERLLSSGGSVQVLLHDLDDDGVPEVFAVALRGAEAGGDSAEELARFGRLFEPERSDVRFTLLVLAERDGRLRLLRSVDLGTWKVLAGMDIRRVSRDRSYPLGLTFVFQTLEGAEHVWVVLGRDAGAAPARAVFHETLSSDVSVLDVDGDGVLDVVTSEREMERSDVTETYLTWYRWSASGFREQASTVVVRNLVQFLFRTRSQLLDRDYDALVRDALEPAAVQRLRRAGLGSREIIARFFPAAPELDSVRELVLPVLRSSPFRLPSEAPPAVALQIRVVDTQGTAHFVEILLAVARNPFQPRQFSLLPTRGVN